MSNHIKNTRKDDYIDRLLAHGDELQKRLSASLAECWIADWMAATIDLIGSGECSARLVKTNLEANPDKPNLVVMMVVPDQLSEKQRELFEAFTGSLEQGDVNE